MISQIIDIFLHLDVHLAHLAATFGVYLYVILFFIIFAETGLVVAPFLPGDSLLFAVGALAALETSGLNIWWLWGLLIAAAFIGDNTNYQIGKHLGVRVFTQDKGLLFSKKHLIRTQHFYTEHGAKTVFFARFMPIFRTFAPFVAGVGHMNYRKFMLFSLVGSFVWMSSFLGAGYYFGNQPSVKDNFHIVIFAVIGISLLPMIITALKSKLGGKKKAA